MIKIRGVFMLLTVVAASSLLTTSLINPISQVFSLFVGMGLPDSIINSYASAQNITSNGNNMTIEEGKYIIKDITFPCSNVKCSGWLYLPYDLQPGEKAPGIVTANPITAIKQIASPNYAERLAQAGFAVLVFDYRSWGSSEGEPRNHIAPYNQVQDVKDAITWLQNQPEIDPELMGGLGVSMGGAHMLYLATFDNRLDAVVAVATAINGVNMWQGMFGKEAFNQIIDQDSEDRANRFENNITQNYKNAWGMPGDSNCVFCVEEAYRYYTNAQKLMHQNSKIEQQYNLFKTF
jgi:alpha/beta superfamily hydrolase